MLKSPLSLSYLYRNRVREHVGIQVSLVLNSSEGTPGVGPTAIEHKSRGMGFSGQGTQQSGIFHSLISILIPTLEQVGLEQLGQLHLPWAEELTIAVKVKPFG
jgi:hypothetical protein